MAAREENWIMVRLKRTTREALWKLGNQWQERGLNGDDSVPWNPDKNQASIDEIVQELMRRNDVNVVRNQTYSRSGKRRKAVRKQTDVHPEQPA